MGEPKHAAGLSDEDFSAMAAYAKELRSDPGASFDTEIELNADDTASNGDLGNESGAVRRH